MQSDCIEAIIYRDISRYRIVHTLLRLDRYHAAPTGHRSCPFDRVHADIGAAVDRHDAVAVMLTTQFEQFERQFNLWWIVGGRLKNLVADAIATIGTYHL